MTISIRDTTLFLLPEKAVFLPESGLLLIADVHLGKLAHFRSRGISVPQRRQNEDLDLIEVLLQRWQPRQLVFLGDLFHSERNSEYAAFSERIAAYPGVDFILTTGNHDIISAAELEATGLILLEELVLPGGLVLRHELPAQPVPGSFYIRGHEHPGCVLNGRGLQSFRLPCYYISGASLVLPAFGHHTGLYLPRYSPADTVFAVMGPEVLRVQGQRHNDFC